MGSKSCIEWTDSTWNPVTGCHKVSAGCKHCYAEVFAERWRGIEGHPYEQGFDLKMWPERLSLPLSWREPKMIFVNSMSDLFHEDIPDSFIEKVFFVMCEADHHVYQILTKRSERMMEWVKKYFTKGSFSKHYKKVPSHIWLGASVENNDYLWRVNHLQKTLAQVRFLSIEPLLGSIKFTSASLKGVHWVIVGGESGVRARPMDIEWAREIRKECVKNQVAFFFKQWGTYDQHGIKVGKKHSGRVLDGRTWDELPMEPSQAV